MIKEPLTVEIHRAGFEKPVRVDYKGGPYAAIPGVQAGDHIVTPAHDGKPGSIATRHGQQIGRQVLRVVPSAPGASLPLTVVRVQSIGGEPSLGYVPEVPGVEGEKFDHGLPADCCPAYRSKVEKAAREASKKAGGK